MTSVISMAKSLLVDGRLNASNNAPLHSALMSLDKENMPQEKVTDHPGKKPTSSYLCSSCKTQLFTNLDIKIHEHSNEDGANHDSHTSAKAARRSNRNSVNARKSMQISHRE